MDTLHKGDNDDDNNNFTVTVCEEKPFPWYSFCDLMPLPEDG